MTTLAPVKVRHMVLWDMMRGLASLHNALQWLTVDGYGDAYTVTVKEFAHGWSRGETRTWALELVEDSPKIRVWLNGALYDCLPPMDALMYMHGALTR